MRSAKALLREVLGAQSTRVRRAFPLLLLPLGVLAACTAWVPAWADGAGKVSEQVAIPRMAASDAATLSPDGSHVARMHTQWSGGSIGNSTVQVWDAKASRIVASYSLPTTNNGLPWSQATNRLLYCDAGKYLVASDWNGKYYVLDTARYQPHLVIDLDRIQLPADSAQAGPGFPSAWSECAANGGVAVFHVVGGRFGGGVTRAFDLNSGEEIGSTSLGSLDSINCDTVAVSPGGVSVALALGDVLSGKSVAVIDLRANKARIGFNAQKFRGAIRLAFVGDSAIAVASGDFPRDQNPPQIHLWDVSSGSEIETLGDPKQGSFAFLAASADGGKIFGFTAGGHQCSSCNWGEGEWVVTSPRFIVWDVKTRQAIAQSPPLHMIHHTCAPRWMRSGLGGACEAFYEVPNLEMSQHGNSVLATWGSGDQPAEVFNIAASF